MDITLQMDHLKVAKIKKEDDIKTECVDIKIEDVEMEPFEYQQNDNESQYGHSSNVIDDFCDSQTDEDTVSDSDSISGTSDSDEEQDSSEDNIKDDAWNLDENVTRNLEPFEGETGLKHPPSNFNSIPQTTELFLDDDFFKILCDAVNNGYVKTKRKLSKKVSKWVDVTAIEMKKFLATIILMEHVKKCRVEDYWSTDPAIETPIFGNTITRNRFNMIWWSMWTCSSTEPVNDSDICKLKAIRPVLDYLTEKIRNVYKPNRKLALDEAMILSKGSFKFHTYNPRKHTKRGTLIRVVYEIMSGYVSNIEVSPIKDINLKDKILYPVLQPYFGLWHTVYLYNLCSSYVTVAEYLFDNKIRICTSIKSMKNLPSSLQHASKKRTMMHVTRGEIMLLVWKFKKVYKMMSTIHDANSTTQFRKSEQKPKSIPVCVFNYNRNREKIKRPAEFISHHSTLRKTAELSKHLVMWFINVALFDAFTVFMMLNPIRKLSFKKYLLEIVRDWMTDKTGTESNRSATNSEPVLRKYVQRKDPPGRLSGDMSEHTLVKIPGSNKTKSNYPSRQCRVCAVDKKRSSTRYFCRFCQIPLHHGECFSRYHTLKRY